jgi:PDZ domain-containing protein
MRRTSPSATVVPTSRRFPKVKLSLTWIAVLPAGVWAILNLYLPILGGFLTPLVTWTVTALIVLLAAVSIGAHLLAHLAIWRPANGDSLPGVTLFVFGDASQSWPGAASGRRETLAAIAGPFANLVLAGLSLLVWNAQPGPVWNLSMLFTAGFNAWLGAINLIPAFPLDGGRLIRLALRWAGMPALAAARLTRRLGWALCAVLAAWGILLLAQASRFSLETGGVTLLFSTLLLAALREAPAAVSANAGEPDQRMPLRTGRLLIAGLAFLVLLALPAALLLTNSGLDAPGLALSVEPMVSVPPQYGKSHAGTFILTSVLEQAPITAGEWLAARLNPAVRIVSPQDITPSNITPQEQARQGFEMLDQSVSTAIGVGMQLAGYPATISGTGAQIVSILPESPANGPLAPGDVVTALNGHPIRTTSDLIDLVKAQQPGDRVDLTVDRGGSTSQVTVPLMPPAAPGGPPRLGVSIQTAGFDVHTPFPVTITPQKIVGGPSAGLMFTLAVYNALTPQDLTGGRRIAGTGTINPDGSVGPIGGVQQKVAAAEAAGAEYFLSPVENYPDALAAAKNIRVVEIATAQQAIDFLRGLPPK